jgi:hypothetical protein
VPKNFGSLIRTQILDTASPVRKQISAKVKETAKARQQVLHKITTMSQAYVLMSEEKDERF